MISSVLIASIMFQQVTSISFLEVLLHHQITESQCEVRCQDLETREEVVTCLEVCREVVTNPESSLCTFTQICTGACRAACGHQVTDQDIIINTVEQRHCSLSWSINNHQSDVRFIVTGLDQGGMINLISSNTRDTSIIMTSQMMEKYLEITVVAVGADGVKDVKSSYIQPEEQCSEETEDTTTTTEGVTEEANLETTTVADIEEEITATTEADTEEDHVLMTGTGQDHMILTIVTACALGAVSAVLLVLVVMCLSRRCSKNKHHQQLLDEEQSL